MSYLKVENFEFNNTLGMSMSDMIFKCGLSLLYNLQVVYKNEIYLVCTSKPRIFVNHALFIFVLYISFFYNKYKNNIFAIKLNLDFGGSYNPIIT